MQLLTDSIEHLYSVYSTFEVMHLKQEQQPLKVLLKTLQELEHFLSNLKVKANSAAETMLVIHLLQVFANSTEASSAPKDYLNLFQLLSFHQFDQVKLLLTGFPRHLAALLGWIKFSWGLGPTLTFLLRSGPFLPFLPVLPCLVSSS